MNKIEAIVLSIGDLITRLIFDKPIHENMIRKYSGFITNEEQDFDVNVMFSSLRTHKGYLNHQIYPGVKFQDSSVSVLFSSGEGYIDFTNNKGILYTQLDTITMDLEYFLRILYAIRSYYAGGFMLHAAGIVHNYVGYAFVGHSGAGKTTIVKNSPEKLIFSDDLILVFCDKGNQIVMHSTPFSNTILNLINHTAILKKVFFLQKDDHPYINAVGYGEALAEIIGNIPVIVDNMSFTDNLFDRTTTFLDNVSYSRLHFLPDPSFWKVIDSSSFEL